MYTYTAFVRCRVVLVSQMCVRLFDKIHFQHSIVDRVLINISFTFLNVQDHIYIQGQISRGHAMHPFGARTMLRASQRTQNYTSISLTMSTFLIEGTTFHSKQSMKASILQATAASSKAFRIVVNRDHRYLVCCASHNAGKGWRKNPFICPWSVECKPTSMHHCTWKIVNIVGNHTCSDEDSNRKRNYHRNSLQDASQVLQSFIPSKKSCGAR